MQIEDRLDALLTTRLNGTPQSAWAVIDDELMPLLWAADALEPLRGAQPSTEFARSLERRLLAYAASRAADSDVPAPVSSVAENRLSEESSPASSAEPRALKRIRGRLSARVRHPWQFVAAAVLLLIVGASVLSTAAASAGPGSPLFGLHRAEQNVRVQLTSSQGDRVRLHLSYAHEALTALDSAVAQRSGDPAYSSALSTLLTEQQAAADELASMPVGVERDGLSTQLANLRSNARGDLHAALHAISWQDRLTTTQALGELGEAILSVQDVKITHVNGQNVHLVQIVVSGTGFTPGAVVMVDSQQVGKTTSASATQLIAEIDTTTTHVPLRAIGVSNPDGTAALSPRIEQDTGANEGGGNTGHPTPVAHPTPTPRDGHGHGNGNGESAGQMRSRNGEARVTA